MYQAVDWMEAKRRNTKFILGLFWQTSQHTFKISEEFYAVSNRFDHQHMQKSILCSFDADLSKADLKCPVEILEYDADPF